MTQSKREPFAYFETHVSDGKDFSPEGETLHLIRLSDTGFGIGSECDPEVPEAAKENAEKIVEAINAAHDKAVAEAVKKAVEEFRERAEIVARQECGGKCGGDRGCEISRKIMEIPTEPERGKE